MSAGLWMVPGFDPGRRASGSATRGTGVVCDCTNWAQPLDTPNVKAWMRGDEELDHAPLCNGRGQPHLGLILPSRRQAKRARCKASRRARLRGAS